MQGKVKEVKRAEIAEAAPCWQVFLLPFSSSGGREQRSQQNSMAFVIGKLGTEAVKSQPLTAACSIFTFCRIEIKQMTR